MTTSHSTPRILTAAFIAVLTMIPLAAQRVAEPELLLREALHKQQVEGDLPGAIKLYQQIVAAKSANRAVTARALLELAGCYEKLGRQSETVYQQIVREFGDQPVAVQARARLAALRPPAPPPTMTMRRLEVADDVLQVLATDGQRGVFIVRPGTVVYGDLLGKERRTLIEAQQGGRGAVSRDLSSHLVYRPRQGAEAPKLIVVKTDGSGQRELQLRENGKPFTFNAPGPLGLHWSWDNRYVLMGHPEPSGSRLLRIDVADGTVVDVVPGRRGGTNAYFSPDGRFIAYREDLVTRGPIHVVPVSGGGGEVIATDATLVDWTRDGRHVLIREDGPKGMMLSAVPVHNGRKAGERIQLRLLPGPVAQTMLNGSLLLSLGDVPLAQRESWIGILDDATAAVTWSPVSTIGSPIPSTFFAWAPDATRFAYVTGDVQQSVRIVRVKTLATGEDRELYRADRLIGCAAAHQQPVLFCARAVDGDTEVVEVVLESGRVEQRGRMRGQRILDQVTSDDRSLVFYDGRTNAWVEWEIGTGNETAVPLYRSADGRWSFGFGLSDRPAGMHVRPAADANAEWRFLAERRLPAPGYAALPVRVSPDGDWLVYHDRDAGGKDGLYRVATAGGAPQRIGDYPTGATTSALTISRDGRRFILHAPRRAEPSRDYWILDNFLPASASGTAAAAPGQAKR